MQNSISHWKVDAEILNQILGNQIQHYIERITYHNYSKDKRIFHHPQIIDVMCHSNKMIDKNRMVILIDAENLKNSSSFHGKILRKWSGGWGECTPIQYDLHIRSPQYYHTQWWKLKAFFLRSWIKQGCLL